MPIVRAARRRGWRDRIPSRRVLLPQPASVALPSGRIFRSFLVNFGIGLQHILFVCLPHQSRWSKTPPNASFVSVPDTQTWRHRETCTRPTTPPCSCPHTRIPRRIEQTRASRTSNLLQRTISSTRTPPRQFRYRSNPTPATTPQSISQPLYRRLSTLLSTRNHPFIARI